MSTGRGAVEVLLAWEGDHKTVTGNMLQTVVYTCMIFSTSPVLLQEYGTLYSFTSTGWQE